MKIIFLNFCFLFCFYFLQYKWNYKVYKNYIYMQISNIHILFNHDFHYHDYHLLLYPYFYLYLCLCPYHLFLYLFLLHLHLFVLYVDHLLKCQFFLQGKHCLPEINSKCFVHIFIFFIVWFDLHEWMPIRRIKQKLQ